MSNNFIATVLAGAMTLTSFSATPAQANLSDFEKLLLGAGALVIIGTAIHEAEKRKPSKKATVTRKNNFVHNTRKPKRPAALPRFCLRNVSTYQGPQRIFGGRCLRNNYAKADRLPRRCRVVIDGPRGTRFGYGPRCLRQAGYRVKG